MLPAAGLRKERRIRVVVVPFGHLDWLEFHDAAYCVSQPSPLLVKVDCGAPQQRHGYLSNTHGH